MDAKSSCGVRVYRVRPLIVVSLIVVATFLAVGGVGGGLHDGHWGPLVIFLGLAALVLPVLGTFRLEVGPEGFRQRNYCGWSEAAYKDVTRASVILDRAWAHGTVSFLVKRKDGKRLGIDWNVYP